MTERLRIALIRGDLDTERWEELLGSGRAEIRFARNAEEASKEDADIVVAGTPSGKAVAFLEDYAARPDAPPLTLLVSSRSTAHPYTRLTELIVGAKREWESTFDAIQDPIVIVGTGGVVARANRGFAALTELPIDGVVGRKVGELLPSPLTGDDPIASFAERGDGATREIQYPPPLGYQLVTTWPLRLPRGQLRLLVVFKDVSDIKRQNELLVQAARLADIGQLAGGVAHEISTPLASIALRAESLARAVDSRGLADDTRLKNFQRYLKTIQEETFRCKKIITALLDFARSHEPEVGTTDLNTLCTKTADLLQHELKAKKLVLDLSLAPEPLTLTGNADRLNQALVAVLMNAVEHSPEGGRIALTTRKSTAVLEVEVADEGPGVKAADRDKVFNPFFTTKGVGAGAGLGLAVCHGVVTAHGGRVRFEDADRGARVVIAIPIANGTAATSHG